MEKTKELKKYIKNNGKKKKPTRDEMIKQLEEEISQIVKVYHQKTGALAYLKELD